MCNGSIFLQNSFILQRVISFILSWILNNKDLDTVHHRMCSVFFLSVSGKTQHINFQFPVIKMRYPHFYCRQSKRRSEPWKIKRNEISSLIFSHSFFLSFYRFFDVLSAHFSRTMRLVGKVLPVKQNRCIKFNFPEIAGRWTGWRILPWRE